MWIINLALILLGALGVLLILSERHYRTRQKKYENTRKKILGI